MINYVSNIFLASFRAQSARPRPLSTVTAPAAWKDVRVISKRRAKVYTLAPRF